ncbi:MAG: HepT-like ribonuclease domain-containing protein [Geminicoccaceae bacterium]
MADKTPRLYLEHIREAIAIIERRAAGKTLDDLVADDVLRDAVERRIEMISEASRPCPRT